MYSLFDKAPIEQLIDLIDKTGYQLQVNDGHVIALVKE